MGDAQRWDVIIVGAGPAGLAAGLYTSRDRLRTLLLDKSGLPGGQIMLTERIENYPGFDNIPGPSLIDNMVRQCRNFGAEIQPGVEVVRIERLDDGMLQVTSSDGRQFSARVVILSPGSSYRRLNVPGEREFTGSGVSYCGTCDAPFFRDRHVVSVGGGNTAIEETLHLARFCSKVTLVHRRGEFRAQRVLVEELEKTIRDRGNIELKLGVVVEEIRGDNQVKSVLLRDVNSNQQADFACQGVFIFVGMVPNTGFVKDFVDLDANGFIRCDPTYLRTRVPGVFAAGDCRSGSVLQLATACGDGVVAAMALKQYLKSPAWWTHGLDKAVKAAVTAAPAGW